MTMLRTVLCLLLVAATSAEYTWTGTEWKWQNPEDTKDSGLAGSVSGGVEGSGDSGGVAFGSDDEDSYDDEDDYDYDEDEEDYEDYSRKQEASPKTPKFNSPQKTPARTYDRSPDRTLDRTPYRTPDRTPASSSTFDDEDLSEGSGDDDFEDDFEGDEGSGGFSPTIPVTQTPRRVKPVRTDAPRRQDVAKDFGGFPDEDPEDNLYVDPPYNPREDDVFIGNSDYDGRGRVEVTSTTETFRKQEPKTTESPTVHREGTAPHRPVSFFAQPGILAAVIGGAVVGLLCAILLVMFIVYRMRKKDEGSYALDEPKRAHNANSYSKPPSREFYA